jgi:general secretion pathway protein G
MANRQIQSNTPGPHIRRCGFTLIELVIVVLILGIIGAIATPKMLNTMSTARTNAARENVQLVRQAIDMYQAHDPNNNFPPAATFTTAIQPYLNGQFPVCPIGQQTATVFASSASPLVVSGTSDGWLYNQSTGDFAINDAVGITF